MKVCLALAGTAFAAAALPVPPRRPDLGQLVGSLPAGVVVGLPQEPTKGIVLGRDGAFFENGKEWVPVVRISSSSTDHLKVGASKAKLSDSAINALRGSFHASMFWLQCGPCNAYVQQDLEWAATRKANSVKIEYCSLSPDGPFRKSGFARSEVKDDVHHGVDCYGIQTVYGKSSKSAPPAAGMMREAYEESIEGQAQPGCFCNGVSHAGVMYVSTPPKLGRAGATSKANGRVWIPVVNIPATSTEHVHVLAAPGVKLADVTINQLRGNYAGSMLWLKCGSCNIYVKQDAAFAANGELENGKQLSQCANGPVGPFVVRGTEKFADHARGLDCSRSGVAYQRGSTPGCVCNGEAWRPGTLYVAGSLENAPAPIPTAKPLPPLGVKDAVTMGGHKWIPVVQIFGSNIDHIIGQQTDYKLGDDEINALRGDFKDSTFMLKCGRCTAFVRQDRAWVSDGFASANSREELCSSRFGGPFARAGSKLSDSNRGIDCTLGLNTVYQSGSETGCVCHGEAKQAGTLFVNAGTPLPPKPTAKPTAAPTNPASQDCKVDTWTEFSTCTESCGGGIKQRFRSVIQKALFGGNPCPPLDEARNCHQEKCPDTCHYNWSPWGPCSKLCGGGVQTRHGALIYETSSIRACRPRSQSDRMCGTKACPTPAPTVAPTPAPTAAPTAAPTPAPVDCVTSPWAVWTLCTKTCGGGTQKHRREVASAARHGGKACGALEEARPCGQRKCPAPVDCVVSDWVAWSPCTVSCGTGQTKRARFVKQAALFGGKACAKELVQQSACNLFVCPTGRPTPPPTPAVVDCVLSLWGQWSKCSKACEGGVQSRTRSESVAAQHGGKACGILEGVRNCNMRMCPINCKVSAWGTFGACDRVCGGAGGRERRHRYVIVKPIFGGEKCPPLEDVRRGCAPHPCKIDCEVGLWSIPGTYAWWSKGFCSKMCGGGTFTRTRKLIRHAAYGGKPCPTMIESHPCNMFACPESCEMSAWSPWGKCNKKCGAETKSRWRTVVKGSVRFGGVGCPSQHETVDCKLPPCAVDCQMGSWTSWRGCSKSCGATKSGQRSRERVVLFRAQHGGKACGATKEASACTMSPCPVDCQFSLSDARCGVCSTTCGKGSQKCQQKISMQPKFGGKACPPTDKLGFATVVRSCGTRTPCPVDCKVTAWNFSKCTKSCGSGLKSGGRTIVVEAQHGGKACPKLTTTVQCGAEACPIDCTTTPFTPWSPCTRSCGGGKSTRTRKILGQPKVGGKACGATVEHTKCNVHRCDGAVCDASHLRCYVDYTRNKQITIMHNHDHRDKFALPGPMGQFHCGIVGKSSFNRLFERCECRCNKHAPCCSKENYVLGNDGLVGNTFKGVKSIGDCCQKCTFHPQCGAWEYSANGVCILKGGTPKFVKNPLSAELKTWAGARSGGSCGHDGKITPVEGNWPKWTPCSRGAWGPPGMVDPTCTNTPGVRELKPEVGAERV